MSTDKNTATVVIDGSKEGTNGSERRNKHNMKDNSNVPVDRGWAWMILLGSMIQMTLVVGLQKASGIIFVAFQQRFNSTSAMTSLLSTVQNAAYSLSAPIIMTVGLKLTSFRIMLYVGSCVTTLSYVISAYATEIETLLFSYGILQGIGMAFMVPPSVSILGIYFLERRGFANSVAVSGASIGGFLMAPLITYLLKTFGYQGCMLLIGGVLLNCCITGALFRPKSFYEKRSRNVYTSRLLLSSLNDNFKKNLTVSPKDVESVLTRFKARTGPSVNKQESEGLFRSLPELTNNQQHIRPRALTNTSQMSNWKNTERCNIDKNGKMYDSREYFRSSAFDMFVERTDEPIETNKNKSDKLSELFNALISSFDFKLFKNPIFNLLLIIAFLVCASSLLAAIFLAPFAHDIDIDAEGIATIVTVFSGVDLISRIVIGLISDRGWLRRSTIVGMAAIIDGVASQFLTMFSSFNSLMIYTVILGMFSGAYFALFPVIVVDYLSLEKLNSVIGFVALFNGAGVGFTFYLMGYIRDVTGSYIASYHVIGGMSLTGGVLLMLLPIFQKHQLQTKTSNTDINIHIQAEKDQMHAEKFHIQTETYQKQIKQVQM